MRPGRRCDGARAACTGGSRGPGGPPGHVVGRLLSVWFAWFLLIAAGGEPSSITAEVHPSTVRLGDPFDVRFLLVHPSDVRYHVDQPVRWGSLEVKEARIERGEGQTVVHVRAAVYDQLGDVELPPFPIQARGADGNTVVELPGPALKIETVATSDELEDILPPVDVKIPRHSWWIVSLAACVVAAGGFLLWRNRSRWMPARRDTPIPVGPPDVRAFAALDEWETSVSAGATPAHYFRLSQIVRGWLEEVARIPAPEMTSQELLEALEARAIAGLDRDRFAAWLERGDGIRYARLPVGGEEAAADLEEARTFIRSVAEAAAAPGTEAA